MQSIVGMLVLGTHRPRRADQPALAVARHADPSPKTRSSVGSSASATGGSSRPTRRWTASLAMPSATYICRDPSSARRGAVGSRPRRRTCASTTRGPFGWPRPASPIPTSSCRRKGPRHRATTSDGSSTTTTSRPAAVRTGSPTTASRSRPTGTPAAAPNVHLFHYADMWADLDAEMRRVADVLGIAIDEGAWPALARGGDDRLDASRAPRSRRRTPTRGCGGRPSGSSGWAAPVDGHRTSRPAIWTTSTIGSAPERRCRRVGRSRGRSRARRYVGSGVGQAGWGSDR